MKRMIICLMLTMTLFSGITMAIASFEHNTKIEASGPNGPAPNSGDGVPDGSGNDAPFGPVMGN